jgi:hypothetical protein
MRISSDAVRTCIHLRAAGAGTRRAGHDDSLAMDGSILWTCTYSYGTVVPAFVPDAVPR